MQGAWEYMQTLQGWDLPEEAMDAYRRERWTSGLTKVVWVVLSLSIMALVIRIVP